MSMKYLSTVIAAASLLWIAPATETSAASSLSGSWKGGGTMTLNSGAKERVSCRVKYFRQSSTTFSMSAKCASGAGSLNQTGSLIAVGTNKYSGTVFNAKHGITANVYITLNGRKQNVSISSSAGSASLSLRK